jgi:hypothetical protein
MAWESQMKATKLLCAAAVAAMFAVVGPASAHDHDGGHWRGGGQWHSESVHWHGGGGWHGHDEDDEFHGGFGFVIGDPFWPWGPPDFYYPPTVVEVPVQPPTYIEQDTPPGAGYWYYCRAPRGYYPYVRSCPGGWQQVAPQPPRQ